MFKNMKYPIEAFALAVILFSSSMKEAMVVGIGLIFGTVLLHVLREFSNEKIKYVIFGIGGLINAGVFYLLFTFTYIPVELKQILGLVIISGLLVKYILGKDDETDYNEVLFINSCTYGLYVLTAIIREFISTGSIFGTQLFEVEMMSLSFAKVFTALIFAGIFIAIINKIFKQVSDANSALWVCIPTICLEVPFIMNNVNETIGMVIGILFVGVVYMTLRKKLVFSNTSDATTGLPVELVMLGIVYMIFTIL